MEPLGMTNLLSQIKYFVQYVNTVPVSSMYGFNISAFVPTITCLMISLYFCHQSMMYYTLRQKFGDLTKSKRVSHVHTGDVSMNALLMIYVTKSIHAANSTR